MAKQEEPSQHTRAGRWQHFLSPLSVAIVVAAVSFFLTGLIELEETSRTLKSEELRATQLISAERQRRETQIILNALSAESREERVANLEFLARAGLIQDERDAILSEAARLREATHEVAPSFFYLSSGGAFSDAFDSGFDHGQIMQGTIVPAPE